MYHFISSYFLRHPSSNGYLFKRKKSSEESIKRELIIEGVIALAENAPSMVIEQKLNSFLSNSQKKEIEQLEKQG